MSTRRDDLVAALTNVEENGGELADDFVPPSAAEVPETPETQVEAAPATPETTSEPKPASERPRDEHGRFAKSDPAAPNPAAVAGAPETPQPAASVDERPAVPKSWKQDMRVRWDSLDPETARYVAQREEEMSRGIEQFRQQNEPALSLFQTIAPWVQNAAQRGQSIQQIANDARDLFYTRELLMTSDPQTKLQTLCQIAQSVGLPLAQMLQGQTTPEMQQAVNPEVMALRQRLQQIEGTLTEAQQRAQMEAQQQVEREIAAFAGDAHPHFDALRETMARLLQAGEASDLESAYSKALRLHDDLFEQHQAQQRQAAEAQARHKADKAAKAARSNAVSTRSATPGVIAAPTGGAPKGRRAALEEAFSGMQSGRI